MELGGADAPLLFGPYYPFTGSPTINSERTPASHRLLSEQADQNVAKGPPPPQIPIIAGNWPPSRKREEARVLKALERRVGSFRVNRGTEKEDVAKPSDENKTDSPLVAKGLPLLKKILSNKPQVVNNNSEADTEWYTSDFISECMCWHNVYRQRHGAPPLSMCPDLCSYAQEWANTLAHTNTFRYRNSCKDVGQNIYCRLNVKDPSEVTGQQVSSYWYGACRNYDFLKEPDVLHANVNTGHFTQMIWASTCDIGIGIARSRAGKVMVVANYRPSGNVTGTFQENVLPPLAEYSSDASSEYS